MGALKNIAQAPLDTEDSRKLIFFVRIYYTNTKNGIEKNLKIYSTALDIIDRFDRLTMLSTLATKLRECYDKFHSMQEMTDRLRNSHKVVILAELKEFLLLHKVDLPPTKITTKI
jgi:hypothetical protein